MTTRYRVIAPDLLGLGDAEAFVDPHIATPARWLASRSAYGATPNVTDTLAEMLAGLRQTL